MSPLRIRFAPDYREGNPYQELLAKALGERGHHVEFLTNYRRGLPLSRAAGTPDILHIHWPEKYLRRGGILDLLRGLRFPLDLHLATRSQNTRLITTAHNLWPHQRTHGFRVRANIRHINQRADAVIAHSDAAATAIADPLQISQSKIHTIPHGDLTTTFPPLSAQADARAALGLGEEPLALMFGAISRYKGIDKVMQWWGEAKPPIKLAVVGGCSDEAYLSELQELAHGQSGIRIEPHFQEDKQLATWLSAASCTLFAYDDILTSGSACQSRSLGIPIVLGDWLPTIDLLEPHSSVVRFSGFDQSLTEALEKATSISPRQPIDPTWQNQSSWQEIARLHETLYSPS